MKLIYIDMDDTLADFSGGIELKKSQNPAMNFPQAEYGFFSGLNPIQDAIKAVNTLAEKYDVYLLTAPSTRNPFSYAEKRVWVEKYLGMEMVEKLIISPNKGLLKGDILIDDNIKGYGQESFEGELIQFGSRMYPSWEVILLNLMTRR